MAGRPRRTMTKNNIDVLSMSSGTTAGEPGGEDTGLWHIKPDGRPGKCHARRGRCPYGGADGTSGHYPSKAEAIQAHERDVERTMTGMSGPLSRKDLDGLTQGEFDFDSPEESGQDALPPRLMMTAQREDANVSTADSAKAPPTVEEPDVPVVLNEDGIDEAHARWLRDTAFSDEVLTNAPLARIKGVPARLQPLEQDLQKARHSWRYEWSTPGTREFLESKGIDVDDLMSKRGLLEGPAQRTYMGLNPDGSEAVPPVGDPRRQEALDALATEYDRKLQELNDMYTTMRRGFQADYKDEYVHDYSCPRLLAHWGRSLADEKAYIESLGGASSFERPSGWTRKPESKAVAQRRRWYQESTGKSTLPRQGAVPIWEGEMDRPYFADQMAREVCLMQGRPREDAHKMAEEARAVRDGAIADARAQGMDDWSVYVAGRDAYREALMDMTYSAPLSDQQVTMIDIETTGLDATSFHVQDVGWCTMSLNDPGERINDPQTRRFGNGESMEATGNPTARITGLTTEDLRGRVPLDKDPDAQAELLRVLTSRPFMAHNARYEDEAFKANIRGYAEAKRAGQVQIMDSMVIARRYDVGSGRHRNTLEAYSRRWGVIAEDQGERHLGFEDAVVMGMAAGRNLRTRFAERSGTPLVEFHSTYDTGRSSGVSYDVHGAEVPVA